MKKKIMKSAVMIFVTDLFFLMPLSIFIDNDVMFNVFGTIGFVLGSSILITMFKILLDEIMD